VANETIRKSMAYDSWASSLLPIVVAWLLVVHFFSCAFYLCAEFEGLGDSRVTIHGWDDLQPFEVCVLAVYFAFATTQGTGSGDIVPQTSSEILVVIFMAVVGFSINAYLLGVFVSRLMDAIGERYLYNWQNFWAFLTFKKINPRLERDVLHYFSHKWIANRGSEDPNQVYANMPETIRNNFRSDLLRKLLGKVPTFKMATQPLKMFLATSLSYVEFIPGEQIIKQGDTDPTMLLLEKGFVDVYVGGDRFAQMVSCQGGQFFGEQELFIDAPRSLSLRAVTHVSGWQLTREELRIKLGERPEMRAEVLEVVRILYPDYLSVVEQEFSEDVIEAMRTRVRGYGNEFEMMDALGGDDTDE
jgi:hypothetical protein